MQELMEEMASFTEWRTEAEKELSDANKLLENSSHLSPITIFGESPDDFYNRTVHSGNVGVISIGAISSYVDNALRLPKLNDSIGESAYAI